MRVRRKTRASGILMIGFAIVVVVQVNAADTTLVGGALAGPDLPKYQTHHNEPAGYPGCIPGLKLKLGDKEVEPTPQGMFPKLELYPGSVEHWSAYWFKYCPLRSMFDKQSLLKTWRATELPEAKGAREDYAEPVYWLIRHGTAVNTGKTNPPVQVVRCKSHAPRFALDCGALEPGLYCVRVIAAAETKVLQRHRLPLYMRMTVNDGVKGEETQYRLRCPYVDEFYAVAEFYFNAPEARAYRVTMEVDDGTPIDLLVHNLELHDVLAGHARKVIKTKRTLTAEVAVPVKAVENTPERLAKDEALWNAFPPINFLQSYVYGMGSNDGKENWPRVGAGGLAPEDINAQHGAWEWKGVGMGDVVLVNKTLNLNYTLSDYRAGKPLPDPYPFKDDGNGVWTPPAKEGEDPQNFWPVAEGLWRRMRDCRAAVDSLTKRYLTGDAAAGRDAAVMLCRIAYQFPTITARNTMHAVLVQPGSWGRDHGCRRRDPKTGFLAGVEICRAYDLLFDLLKSDAGLAQSVGRFIPWVKSPEDILKLMDVYLVQTTAERCLRYHDYSSNTPADILVPVTCLGDNAFTRPWMEWLFSATVVYPLPPSGIQDLLVSANDRNGMGYIGSWFYTRGEQAARQAMLLDDYIRRGGDPRYNLADPNRFPKPLATCYWFLNSTTAGGWFPRTGDVCGPDKGFSHTRGQGFTAEMANGWRWSRDPLFAYMLVREQKPGAYSDAEWKEIEAAATGVTRHPWLATRSRFLPNWGAFLEAGVRYDDVRFRRSAMVRIGQGWGHHHDDVLDLQLHAHGYPMTIDGGQRPGYTKPGDRMTRTHNLVEVDGKGWLGHSWANTLMDMEGAGYTGTEAQPPANHPEVKLYKRQVALVDVDEGAAADQMPVKGIFSKDAASPNSYVVDVQRVEGGSVHTHCFHAMIEDELATNIEEKTTLDKLAGEEAAYAGVFHRDVPEFPMSAQGFAGKAPEVLQATWRMLRDPQGKYCRTEESLHPAIWNAASPRKYTRLHLLGHKGDRVMTGWSHCTQWGYGWTNLFTQVRSDKPLASVFPAIIEPYAGEPFITGVKVLPIAENDTDALRAVALEVLTKNGRRDLVLTDGRPEKTRTLEDGAFAAEFALVSADDQGLRQVVLAGGTAVRTPLVTLAAERAERAGKVIEVDYDQKRLVLQTAWPEAALLKQRVFEIGVPGHMTTYTVREAALQGDNTELLLTEGADFYLSRVRDLDAEKRIVYCPIGLAQNDKQPCPGIDKHWVATNESRSRVWRAEYLGLDEARNLFAFRLDGEVQAKDFGASSSVHLWSYGVGDAVRMGTFVNLRRTQPGLFAVEADTPFTIALKGSAAEWSADGQVWARVAGEAKDGSVTVRVSSEMLGASGRLSLRVAP